MKLKPQETAKLAIKATVSVFLKYVLTFNVTSSSSTVPADGHHGGG